MWSSDQENRLVFCHWQIFETQSVESNFQRTKRTENVLQWTKTFHWCCSSTWIYNKYKQHTYTCVLKMASHSIFSIWNQGIATLSHLSLSIHVIVKISSAMSFTLRGFFLQPLEISVKVCTVWLKKNFTQHHWVFSHWCYSTCSEVAWYQRNLLIFHEIAAR